MTPKELKQFTAVLARLASEHDGERASAALHVTRILAKHNTRPEDLAAAITATPAVDTSRAPPFRSSPMHPGQSWAAEVRRRAEEMARRDAEQRTAAMDAEERARETLRRRAYRMGLSGFSFSQLQGISLEIQAGERDPKGNLEKLRLMSYTMLGSGSWTAEQIDFLVYVVDTKTPLGNEEEWKLRGMWLRFNDPKAQAGRTRTKAPEQPSFDESHNFKGRPWP